MYVERKRERKGVAGRLEKRKRCGEKDEKEGSIGAIERTAP